MADDVGVAVVAAVAGCLQATPLAPQRTSPRVLDFAQHAQRVAESAAGCAGPGDRQPAKEEAAARDQSGVLRCVGAAEYSFGCDVGMCC